MSNKNKGKKPYYRNKKGCDNKRDNRPEDVADTKDKPEELENRSRFGNPNWYFRDKALAEQATNFNFKNYVSVNPIIPDTEVNFASICVIPLNPSIGLARNNTESINAVALRTYAELSQIGRTTNYAPQDVSTLILAMGEILSMGEYIRRFFGMAMLFDYLNRDIPRRLLVALGLTPAAVDDLFTNLANHRMRFNTIVAKANRIPFLAGFSWFDKCRALYETVFYEDSTNLSGIYAFVPATSWKLDETVFPGGTVLRTMEVYSMVSDYGRHTARSITGLMNDWEGMIDALLTSSTYNVIYQDILKLNQTKGFKLVLMDYLQEGYVAAPVHDEEVLLHIHNMTPFGGPTNTDYNLYRYDVASHTLTGRYTSLNDVYPNPNDNCLLYRPCFPALVGVNTRTVLRRMEVVDFPTSNPDLTMRLEATRFASRVGGTDGDWYVDCALSDHYPTGIFYFEDGVEKWNMRGLITNQNAMDVEDTFRRLSDLSHFHSHPYFYFVFEDEATGEEKLKHLFGSLNKFTLLDVVYIKAINDVTYLALFTLE